MSENQEHNDSFRDSISTVDSKGNRVWIHPKKPKGKYYNKRKIVSYLLLLLLFGMPYIKIGGQPLLMFNIIDREFSIFGTIFYPQDFYIFALGMITFVVFVTLFTIIYGRLFCGWVCPQTIFMEMVFRRIEYWIEGDWNHQKKLDRQKWDREKIIKRGGKHIAFWFVSFFISNTFLSYIIGAEGLWEIILAGPFAEIGGFIAIVIFTFVFYGVFAFMREQVCTTVCPYGRLQGVLLDQNSLVVAYDHVRGENRAKFSKNEDRKESGKGDCIDCKQCIHVCPTGIDIRNGTQLECVNCTACMDACDNIMEGVGMEEGLIRIASLKGIETGSGFTWTKRIKVYTLLLAGLMIVLGFMLSSMNKVNLSILRTRGTIYQKYSDSELSNLYDIKMRNKSNEKIEFHFDLIEHEGSIELVGSKNILEPSEEYNTKIIVILPKGDLEHKNEITIGMYDRNNKLIETVETTFVGRTI